MEHLEPPDEYVSREMESWYQLQAEEDPGKLAGQTSTTSAEVYSQQGAPISPGSTSQDWNTQPFVDRSQSLQLEFQDSHLSPAFTLRPCPDNPSDLPSDSTLFQQTDTEFAPLRGYPDLSVVSEKSPRISHEVSLPDQASLSQHPLGATAALIEGESSSCSLSQHSLSPGDHHQATPRRDEGQKSGVVLVEDKQSERQMEGKERSSLDSPRPEDAGWFLNEAVPARSLLELLEKDMGVAVSSSSAVSSASETALNQTEPAPNKPNAVLRQTVSSADQPELASQYHPNPEVMSDSAKVETVESTPTGNREQPQGGGSSSSSTQIKSTGRVSGTSSSRMSDISNITVRSSHLIPNQSDDALFKELQSESQRGRISALGTQHWTKSQATLSGMCVTPRGSGSGGMVRTLGLQRDLSSSGNQMAADGSFLSSMPVSQSTPAVFLSRGPPALTKLSPIDSCPETAAAPTCSTKSSSSKASVVLSLDLNTPDTQVSPSSSKTTSNLHSPPNQGTPQTGSNTLPAAEDVFPPDPPTAEVQTCLSDTGVRDQPSELAAVRVRSLPSLNYIQKVDAWKANQSSNRSLYDNLSLQGFGGVSPNRNAQVSVSESLNRTFQQQTSVKETASASSSQAPHPHQGPSTSGASSPQRGDAVGGAAGAGHSSASPLAHSHSHSSLSTVITSAQQDAPPHGQNIRAAPSDEIRRAADSSSGQTSRHSGEEKEQNPAAQPGNGLSVPSPFFGLGHFSDVSSSRELSSVLSSSQGSFHGGQSLRASVGAASSVVSLEVDNYVPYWTSKPTSPPQHNELNIEDRIPLYLHNLGIDQSPSTILTPFIPRGPIREPEFSPTDLCTVKGSIGTPTKSTQPSEGGSPHKDGHSSSSLASADSSASHQPVMLLTDQDLPVSKGRVRMAVCQTDTPPQAHTPPQAMDTPIPPSSYEHSEATPVLHREGSYGLSAQLSPGAAPSHGTRDDAQKDDSSLVGSGTLQEIRRLLGRAQTLVSGHTSLASSPGSHRFSESDTSLTSLRRYTQGYHDDSSLSTGGNLSLLWARSSSDSALRESSSSFGPLQTPAQTSSLSGLGLGREENLKSRDLCVTPRRAEPEGCSAADPDKAGPTRPSVPQVSGPSPAANLQLNPGQRTDSEVMCSSEDSATRSPVEEELGAFSDSSSESSLAARVARLLQAESPISMVTSRPSTSDPEESRAREWILMKISGRQCEALDLNTEDRERIEEIKRELLLNGKQTKSQWSSDSEGSAQSSNVDPVSQQAVEFAAMRNAEDRLSEQLQRVSQKPLDSSVPLHTPLRQDLEARVRQIALREGLSAPAPITSITIATTRRTPSPQPHPEPLLRHTDHTDTNSISVTHTAPEPDNSPAFSDANLKAPSSGWVSLSAPDSERGRENMGEEEMQTEQGRNTEQEEREREGVDPQMAQGGVHPDDIHTSGSQGTHLSHIHLTLSPKPPFSSTQRPSHTVAMSELPTGHLADHSSRATNQNTFREVSPLRASSVLSSNIDTQLSSGQQSEKGEPVKWKYTETASTSVQTNPRYPQSFTPPQRLARPSRPLSIHTGAMPTLLPYKPHGSSELFYVPKSDQQLSPIRSDTTMESSHTGSDDAVPPCFTAEVLGSRELEDDTITPRHKEGIYSKRAGLKRGTSMSAKEFLDPRASAHNRGNTVNVHDSLEFSAPRAPDDLARVQKVTLRPAHGTERSTVQGEEEEEEEEFAPLHMEPDYSMDSLQHQHSAFLQHKPGLSQPIRSSNLNDRERQELRAQDLSQQIGSSLDQLWHRFCERWSLEETRPTNEGEASVLERLERLSRLIHSTPHTLTDAHPSHSQTSAKHQREGEDRGMTEGRVLKRMSVQAKETTASTKDQRAQGTTRGRVVPTAWEKEPGPSNPTTDEDGSENVLRCPAEREDSVSVSMETSSSRSTIDTERLLRAFGPHRVVTRGEGGGTGQGFKASESLARLYSTINKQKRGRGKANPKPGPVTTEPISTDESSVSTGCVSSSSTYSITSQRAPAHPISAKRPKVKLISRGIQAGDLEIVSNGTRKHTRDVGTTFPSPSSTRDVRTTSSSSTSSSTQTSQQGSVKENLGRGNQAQCYPQGVSWFVSTDEMKLTRPEARKENQPQTESAPLPSRAWFEPYSRTKRREPLRERQIHVERQTVSEPKTVIDVEPQDRQSALLPLSLQEALEIRRPEFVSRSRERVKRLFLLVEERKLQTVFNREREELFNRPGLGSAQPVPAPAPVLRVIPKKEMVQRSKHGSRETGHTHKVERPDRQRRIYAQLPEVRKRREEEKRRAEYRSYRLNAQLFNKRVTNRVLGRRTPWQ